MKRILVTIFTFIPFVLTLAEIILVRNGKP